MDHRFADTSPGAPVRTAILAERSAAGSGVIDTGRVDLVEGVVEALHRRRASLAVVSALVVVVLAALVALRTSPEASATDLTPIIGAPSAPVLTVDDGTGARSSWPITVEDDLRPGSNQPTDRTSGATPQSAVAFFPGGRPER
ncbi:MAG: hypothetical protein AAF547_04615 [Actinomycetota bacterium]